MPIYSIIPWQLKAFSAPPDQVVIVGWKCDSKEDWGAILCGNLRRGEGRHLNGAGAALWPGLADVFSEKYCALCYNLSGGPSAGVMTVVDFIASTEITKWYNEPILYWVMRWLVVWFINMGSSRFLVWKLVPIKSLKSSAFNQWWVTTIRKQPVIKSIATIQFGYDFAFDWPSIGILHVLRSLFSKLNAALVVFWLFKIYIDFTPFLHLVAPHVHANDPIFTQPRSKTHFIFIYVLLPQSISKVSPKGENDTIGKSFQSPVTIGEGKNPTNIMLPSYQKKFYTLMTEWW